MELTEVFEKYKEVFASFFFFPINKYIVYLSSYKQQ